MKNTVKNMRVEFLSWIILPMIGIWLATSYLIGITNTPLWDTKQETKNPQILGIKTNKTNMPQNPDKLQWDGEALVTLWFDDAWDTQFTVAYPMMEDMGFKGSIAVPTYAVGTKGYMSWAQMERLAYAKWEIDSHTRTHECDLNNLSTEKANFEVIGSKEDLVSLGYNPDWFVSPCGVDSPLWRETATKNYLGFRGVENGINSLPLKDTYSIKAKMANPKTTVDEVKQWVAEAKKEKSWLIIAFHQIDDSNSEYSMNASRFGEVLKVVKDSNLQVVLPEQVLNLVVGGNTKLKTIQ
ncbi:MAG: polysaccharide deacetylase family protein [bacterium]|nr:polysaccharide deacetylase family protein [bacterium]